MRAPRWPGATPRARRIWDNIQKRCHTAPRMRQFKNYGGRGIENRITPYEIQALWERDHADLMKQASIDRIDNDGHYTFENCRFIEHSENSRRGRHGKKGRVSRAALEKAVGVPREGKAA